MNMKYLLSIILLFSFAWSLLAQCNKTLNGQINVIDGSTIQNLEVRIVTDIPVGSTFVDDDNKFSISLEGVADDTPWDGYEVQITGNSPNPLDGVSTLDLVLILRHILGIQTFENSSNLIIGDINCDGVITALDIVLLRRLILGIDENFPSSDYCFIATDGSLRERTCSNTTDETLVIEAYKKGNVSDN